MLREPESWLARRLVALARRKKCRSVAKIAARAGVSRQALHPLFAGKDMNPRLETLRKVVGAMGAELHELFDPQLLTEPIPPWTPDPGRSTSLGNKEPYSRRCA